MTDPRNVRVALTRAEAEALWAGIVAARVQDNSAADPEMADETKAVKRLAEALNRQRRREGSKRRIAG